MSKVIAANEEELLGKLRQQGSVNVNVSGDDQMEATSFYTYGFMKPIYDVHCKLTASGQALLYRFLNKSAAGDNEALNKVYTVEVVNFPEQPLATKLSRCRKVILSGVKVIDAQTVRLDGREEAANVWLIEPDEPYFAPRQKNNYTRLSELSDAQRVNVFAVVKWHTIANVDERYSSLRMKLVDPSVRFDRPVTARIKFLKSDSGTINIPDQGVPVVRLHRISCSTENGEPQLYTMVGRGFAMEAWSCLSGVKPKRMQCAHKTCAIHPSDLDLVLKLERMYNNECQFSCIEEPEQYSCVFSFQPGEYKNTVLKVIAVFPSTKSESCTIVRATDGTRPPANVSTIQLTEEQANACGDQTASGPFMVDIFCYDEHSTTSKQLRKGDYALFSNLHCYYKHYTSPTCDLTMHSGKVSGRKITLLPADHPKAVEIEAKLAKMHT